MENKQVREHSFWNGKVGPMLIAEIGGNHEGDFEKAKELTKLAIESGFDCIKFQIYASTTLVNKVLSPDRHSHFKKFELTRDQHVHLAEMCEAGGVKYLASVWDPDAFDWIGSYLSFFTVGSGDLTAFPLLEIIAKKEKPVLLSTGLSTEQQVLDSVAFLRSVSDYYNDPEAICLLQGTAMYPIEEKEANLAVMTRFSQLCNTAVGYSDHTTDSLALKVAVARGASALEFHFSDTRDNQSFRDHFVPLTKAEVQELIKDIGRLKTVIGDPEKKPTESELENGHDISYRRGVFLKSAVSKGDIIQQENLRYLNPEIGTCVSNYKRVVGTTALADIALNEPLVEGSNYKSR